MRNQDNQDKIENNEWMICKKKKKRSAINQNESTYISGQVGVKQKKYRNET